MSTYKVVYDGSLLPMIEGPTGRIFILQELKNGRWSSNTIEHYISVFAAEAMAEKLERDKHPRVVP